MDIMVRMAGPGLVGRMLELSSSRVRQLAAAGALPGVRGLDGRWVFDVADVEAFRSARAAQREGAGAPGAGGAGR